MSFNPKFLLPEDKKPDDDDDKYEEIVLYINLSFQINDSIDNRLEFIKNLAEQNKVQHQDRLKILEEEIKKNKQNCNEMYEEVEKLNKPPLKITEFDKCIIYEILIIITSNITFLQ